MPCGISFSLVCQVMARIQRGESPLWTVMTGTSRLGKGVRREAESEESR